MWRSRALAGGLALAVIGATGCGMSTVEQIKSRDPDGQGETRGPDVSVEGVDDLRGVEVVVAGGRFQPQQVSVGLDSTVRIINNGRKPIKIRKLSGPGDKIVNPKIGPGEFVVLDYSHTGVEFIGLKGSKAKLEVNVFPPG